MGNGCKGSDLGHVLLGAFFFGEVVANGYVTATVILPSRWERGAGLTTISMSRPSRVRHSMSFFSETPRNCPRNKFDNFGCENPSNSEASVCAVRDGVTELGRTGHSAPGCS